MSFYKYSSTGPLERFVIKAKNSDRALRYHVVFLSDDLEAELPFDGPRLRFNGEIEDQEVHLAWQPDGKKRHYAMISPDICRALGLGLGDEVTIRFNLAPKDEVRLDEELQKAIDSSKKRKRLWSQLTPGRQRGLGYFFSSAKTQATRTKRLEVIFDELERGVIEKTGPKRKQ